MKKDYKKVQEVFISLRGKKNLRKRILTNAKNSLLIIKTYEEKKKEIKNKIEKINKVINNIEAIKALIEDVKRKLPKLPREEIKKIKRAKVSETTTKAGLSRVEEELERLNEILSSL